MVFSGVLRGTVLEGLIYENDMAKEIKNTPIYVLKIDFENNKVYFCDHRGMLGCCALPHLKIDVSLSGLIKQ